MNVENAGSGQARAGSSLGTQVDSTSLRTPVTLKSLSTAYQRRRPADKNGLQCNTVPDTRSTASRPVCIEADSNAGISTQQHRKRQHTVPVPTSNTKGSCQQGPPRSGCLTAPAAHSTDGVGSASAPADTSRVVTEHTGLKEDTSRVLFASPQGSAGAAGHYVSPTGGALQEDALQAPAVAEQRSDQCSEPAAASLPPFVSP